MPVFGLPIAQIPIYSQTTVKSGDTITASTSALQFFASNYLILANTLVVGQTFFIQGSGTFSTSTGTAPTIRAGLYFNNTPVTVTPAVSNALGTNNLGFNGTIWGTVVSTGTTGSVRFACSLNFAATTMSGIQVIVPSTVTSINTTINQTLQFGGTYTNTAANNSVTFDQIQFYTTPPALSSN